MQDFFLPRNIWPLGLTSPYNQPLKATPAFYIIVLIYFWAFALSKVPHFSWNIHGSLPGGSSQWFLAQWWVQQLPFHSFLLPSRTLFYGIPHPLTDGHLGCFHFLAIMSAAAINVWVLWAYPQAYSLWTWVLGCLFLNLSAPLPFCDKQNMLWICSRTKNKLVSSHPVCG